MIGKSDLLMLLGAIVIFSLLLMNANNFLFDSSKLEVQSKMSSTAAALAQGIIDQARTKAFDQVTVGGQVPSSIPDGFSATLGPESGETFGTYDDFDDYNGYKTKDTTNVGIFNISVQVNYVTDSNLSQISSNQTTHKRMVVSVTNPVMQDTVKLSYIKSYY